MTTCTTCRGAREVSLPGTCADPSCPRRGAEHSAHERCPTCHGHGALDEHKRGCDGAPCFCGHTIEPNLDLFARDALYPDRWAPPPIMVDMPEGQAE